MSEPKEKSDITVVELKKILGSKAKGLKLKDDLYGKYLEGFKGERGKASPRSPVKPKEEKKLSPRRQKHSKSPRKEKNYQDETTKFMFETPVSELITKLSKASGKSIKEISDNLRIMMYYFTSINEFINDENVSYVEKLINLRKYLTSEAMELLRLYLMQQRKWIRENYLNYMNFCLNIPNLYKYS